MWELMQIVDQNQEAREISDLKSCHTDGFVSTRFRILINTTWES